jgi:feruloyl esterase
MIIAAMQIRIRFAYLLLAPLPIAAATCESLATLALPNTTIATTQSVAAGSFTPPGANRAMDSLPAFCRVAGSIKPSADSDIQFEVWLPASGWNGKFQGIGNGGFAGMIMYPNLGNAVSHGYVVAGTDTGHYGGATDGAWALGHHEKLVDFGYRAIHETALTGKALAKALYGGEPKRSYFSSCSNGGRQALMEAQRYPTDYDGIIAGAPAYNWTKLLSNAAYNLQVTMDPASYIPPAKIPAIEAAALAACDANDGVKDGVIDSPDKCSFKPASMLCKDGESDTCLTEPQVKAMEVLLGGLRSSKGVAFPGYVVGGMPGGNGWQTWIFGGMRGTSLMYAFGNGYFKNMLFEDAKWDYKSYQPDRDIKVADDKTAQILNATDPDLGKFRARGGKLIIYHGWSDPGISPLSTVEYFNNVQAKMGASQTGSFLRVYMAPGMQHCGGGPGPSNFGQGGVAEGDPQHNISSAIEHWVEDGAAPAQIIAAKYKTANPADGVERTRPLCPYPQVATYKGSGSTDDAANFVCK